MLCQGNNSLTEHRQVCHSCGCFPRDSDPHPPPPPLAVLAFRGQHPGSEAALSWATHSNDTERHLHRVRCCRAFL